MPTCIPGNLFVEADGTIVAVDFGITGRLGKKERRFLAEILYGFITRDYLRVAEVHFEAGYVPRTHNVAAFAQAIRAIGEPIHGQPAETISMAKLLTLLFEVTELFDMADAARTGAAAEDHGGGRGRGAHARSGLQHVEDRPSRSSATGSPTISARAACLIDARDGANALLVAGPPGARPRRPHRAPVARDRQHGRARPALRQGDHRRDRQGRGARHPLGPCRALGQRDCAWSGSPSAFPDAVEHAKVIAMHINHSKACNHLASITVRNLDAPVKDRLRQLAAQERRFHGRAAAA